MRLRGSIPSGEFSDGEHRVLTEGPSFDEEPAIAADLVARIAGGARDAEDAMVRRYGPGLLYLLKRRARDPDLALDLRQDALRVAIEKLRSGPIDEPERLAAYLRGVALNLWIAHQRKNARRGTTADSEAVEGAPDESSAGPYEQVSREQVRDAVGVLLGELSTPRDREILKRLYIHDEDKDAICAALGVDATHFNRVLFRAKQRFRELLVKADRRQKLRLVG
jgi:RNA polymerase sigma-70 factor (ECF subfamily)